MEKVLVFVEEKMKAEFFQSVDSCCDRANSLVQIYEAFQEWQRITTEDQFVALCRDPRQYFDKVLTENIHLSAGKAFNVEVAAKLFDIRRDEFFNMIDGIQVLDDSCVPCRKVKVVQKKGQHAILIAEFDRYKDFLTFTNGKFSVNETAVENHVQSFDVYADSIEQVDVFTHYKDLVVILNIHAKKFGLNIAERQAIAKSLHLYLSRAFEGDFLVDNEFIKNKILTLKYNKA